MLFLSLILRFGIEVDGISIALCKLSVLSSKGQRTNSPASARTYHLLTLHFRSFYELAGRARILIRYIYWESGR